MLIDTHCHLDAPTFDADRTEMLSRARRNGVRGFVVPAVDPSNFDTVKHLAQVHTDVAYALGIHPLFVERQSDDAIVALERALVDARNDPKLVAVGEIGLDFFIPNPDRDKQERFYQSQLALAAQFGLPVILHVRKSADRLLKYLRQIPVPGGIAHAFNGSQQQANAFLELGFCLGFGGTLTYQGSRQIRRLVAELPSEAHVLETDSPDIAPEWIARQRNEPAELAAIAKQFAQLRELTAAQATQICAANALRVLPRLANAIDATV